MIYLLILVFLIFSFIFSSAETALFSLPVYKRKGNYLIDRLMKEPRRVIVIVIMANVLANVAISCFSESLLGEYIRIVPAALTVTTVILIFGEYIPKRVAMARPKAISILFSPIILCVEYLFYPILFIFRPFSKMRRDTKGFTALELREVFNKGRMEGVITEQQCTIMNKLSRLNKMVVKELMSPRINVFFAEQNQTVEEVISMMSGWHKRIPVYAGNRDRIIGILELKNLYQIKGPVKSFITPPIFVSENLPVIQLLKIFKNTAQKMVVVINEYGGTSGIVDMEDVKKELIGESEDVFIEQKEENIWIVSGFTDIDEIQDIIPIPTSNDYRTISGFVYTLLERIPREGEEFSYGDYGFTILDIKDNHIRKIRIKKKQ